MGTTLKPVYRRRPRVDPSKLAIDQLTGDENVTVVNRNTGKRITGAKAPTLRGLHEWLIRNPGFDVDAKWAHIVHRAADLPAEMKSRIRQPPSEQIHTPAGCVDPTMPVSAAHNYGRPGSELLNSYFDPTGIHQSFKTPATGHLPVGLQRWDRYPEDDDYSDDGNSDRESSGSSLARQQPPSHLLPVSSPSPMFNASHPYLCSSSVIDRMCATFGQQSNASAPNADWFAARCDQLMVDSRTGGIIHPQYAAPSADQPANVNPFVDSVDLVGNERVLFDGEVEQLASDDEPFRDTGSQSPVIEEDSWQCVVEDGEVELT